MDIHNKITVIEPQKYGVFPNIHQLWQYRNLLFYFSNRQIKRRYSSTVLGWLWLVIRPLVSAIIFTLVFNGIANISSGEIPYLLFFLCGICIWDLFEVSVLFATRSMRSDRRLITKLFFPRIIVPLSSIAPALVEFVVYCGLIVAVSLYYFLSSGIFYLNIRPESAYIIIFFLITLAFSLGIGFFTSVLNAQAKDVRFTLPYFMRVMMFLTPVVYPLSMVPQSWQWLAALNPMTPILEGFRWCLLGNGVVTLGSFIYSAIIVITVFCAGAWFFTMYESQSVDKL